MSWPFQCWKHCRGDKNSAFASGHGHAGCLLQLPNGFEETTAASTFTRIAHMHTLLGCPVDGEQEFLSIICVGPSTHKNSILGTAAADTLDHLCTQPG